MRKESIIANYYMHTLISLPYKSLAPVISDQTLAFHHGKHLQTYVDNLNKLIAGTEYESMPLEEIVRKSSLPAPTSPSLPAPTSPSLPAPTGNPAIFNNAGQVYNHNMYFTQFKTPDQVGGDDKAVMPGPTGHLKVHIEKQWGSLDAFKADFEAKGVSLFGSGWVWLAADSAGTLSILQCPGADSPLTHVMPGSTGHLRPILTFDVWEHAYYLDYQNRRAAHLQALWQIVDWKVISERYDK